MTDTPSESGLPGFYAIDKRSAPLWLAMLYHAILLFARQVMNGMGVGCIANTAWVGNSARTAVGSLAGLNAIRLKVTGFKVGLDGLGLNSCGLGIHAADALDVAGLDFSGLNASGFNVSGLNVSGPNENGSIACSNRPIPETGCGDRI